MSFDAKAWVNELTNNPAMFPVVPDYRGVSGLITAVQTIYNAGLAAGRTEGRDEGLARAGEIARIHNVPGTADCIERERTEAGR